MVFYNGRITMPSFTCNGAPLEVVNRFTYLGLIFTTRLSSSAQVDSIISKTNARIGYLFHSLPIKNLPLHLALHLFDVYVLPIITYGLPVWLPSLTLSSSLKLDRIFTKFLKRFLGLPRT